MRGFVDSGGIVYCRSIYVQRGQTGYEVYVSQGALNDPILLSVEATWDGLIARLQVAAAQAQEDIIIEQLCGLLDKLTMP